MTNNYVIVETVTRIKPGQGADDMYLVRFTANCEYGYHYLYIHKNELLRLATKITEALNDKTY